MAKEKKNYKDFSILDTKLDILIADFQRFRDEQMARWASHEKHTRYEEKEQAEIKSVLTWHTYIGAFIVTAILSFATYIYSDAKAVHTDVDTLKVRTYYIEKTIGTDILKEH